MDISVPVVLFAVCHASLLISLFIIIRVLILHSMLPQILSCVTPYLIVYNCQGPNATQNATTNSVPDQSTAQNPANATGPVNNAVDPVSSVQQQRPAEAEKKRRPSNSGRGRGGVMVLPKGRGSSGAGWTGAGFDVVGGT